MSITLNDLIKSSGKFLGLIELEANKLNQQFREDPSNCNFFKIQGLVDQLFETNQKLKDQVEELNKKYTLNLKKKKRKIRFIDIAPIITIFSIIGQGVNSAVDASQNSHIAIAVPLATVSTLLTGWISYKMFFYEKGITEEITEKQLILFEESTERNYKKFVEMLQNYWSKESTENIKNAFIEIKDYYHELDPNLKAPFGDEEVIDSALISKGLEKLPEDHELNNVKEDLIKISIKNEELKNSSMETLPHRKFYGEGSNNASNYMEQLESDEFLKLKREKEQKFGQINRYFNTTIDTLHIQGQVIQTDNPNNDTIITMG